MRRNAPGQNRLQQDCILVATSARWMPHGVAPNSHFTVEHAWSMVCFADNNSP